MGRHCNALKQSRSRLIARQQECVCRPMGPFVHGRCAMHVLKCRRWHQSPPTCVALSSLLRSTTCTPSPWPAREGNGTAGGQGANAVTHSSTAALSTRAHVHACSVPCHPE